MLATFFRFRQFLFEYGPFFLIAWIGLAITTGLLTVVYQKRKDPQETEKVPVEKKFKIWLRRFILSMLYYPGRKTAAVPVVSTFLIFSLAASIPALLATSLIDINVVIFRVASAALMALSMKWFITSEWFSNPGKQRFEVEQVVKSSAGAKNVLKLEPQPSSVARIIWKSFAMQVNNSLLPLLLGFALASVITVYVPVYIIHPWLGNDAWWTPYLASLLAIPLQLRGGAEVPLASALMVKGATLGTALSVMLTASLTASSVVRLFCRPVNVKKVATYMVTVWLIAGSLGVAVDGIQRLF